LFKAVKFAASLPPLAEPTVRVSVGELPPTLEVIVGVRP
jgi:hypothetical protein